MRRFMIAPNGVRQKVVFPVLAKGNMHQAKRLAHLVRSRGHYARVIPTSKGHSVHVYPNRRTFNKLGERPDPIESLKTTPRSSTFTPIPMGKKWTGRNPVARSDPLGENEGRRISDPMTSQGPSLDDYEYSFEEEDESPQSMIEQYLSYTTGSPGGQ